MEADDEILGPVACGRCGHAFLPAPDGLAFCPRCHAAHRSVPMAADDAHRGEVLDRWIRCHGAPSNVQVAPVGSTLYWEGALSNVVEKLERATTPGGYAVLVERGTRGRPMEKPRPEYMRLRLAGFAPQPMRSRPPHTGLSSLGTLRSAPYGFDLLATGSAVADLERYGLPAALADLDRIAAAVGLEPIHELREAPPSALPPEVEQELGARERTVRCTSCGAPVALRLLASAPALECLYCLQPVAVPAALAHELEGYRRRRRAQDAMLVLDGDRLWQTWSAARGEAGSQLACAVCGAPSPHRPGALDEHCGYCGAPIVPSAEQLAHDLERGRERLADLEARQAARSRRAAALTRRKSSGVTKLVLAINGVAIGGSALVPALARGDFQPFVSVLGPVVGVAVVAGAIVGYLWLRGRRQRRRWSPVWLALGEQLGGELSGAEARAAWLSRWWSAPTPASPMYGRSAAAGTVATEANGLAVQVDGDPEGDVGFYRSRFGGSFFDLRIAAAWPRSVGALKVTAGVRQRRAALARAGFDTVLRRCGLELRAQPQTVRRLRQNPAAAAALVPILYEALRVVTLLGGRPPRPRDRA